MKICRLLAYVFEKFRNNSLKNYGLSRSLYLSAPGLSWDAKPIMTKIELELIPDLSYISRYYLNIYILLEKCARGGISYISNKYSKASNKYLMFKTL